MVRDRGLNSLARPSCPLIPIVIILHLCTASRMGRSHLRLVDFHWRQTSSKSGALRLEKFYRTNPCALNVRSSVLLIG